MSQEDQLRERLDVPVLTSGPSYTFEGKGETEGFLTVNFTAVTTDLSSELFRNILRWKKFPVNPLPVQVLEIQDLERLMERLNSIDNVSGMLNELTPKQMEIFEEAVKRRPLFK